MVLVRGILNGFGGIYLRNVMEFERRKNGWFWLVFVGRELLFLLFKVVFKYKEKMFVF